MRAVRAARDVRSVPTPRGVLDVRRFFTETPLARAHDRTLAKRARGRRPDIPWDSFDRSKYPRAALMLAFDTATRLAQGEYTAVDLFARIASALAAVGAPFDLIAAATLIPTDEIRHADYALRFAALCAGRDSVTVRLDERLLKPVRRPGTALAKLDASMLEISAIGETLACALLGACAERATDPVAKALFDTILSDEIHHARLGWYYLTWRAPQWTPRERQRMADLAGAFVLESEARFGQGRDAPGGSQRAARALGVLETRGQRAVVRAVMRDQIVPGLDALGLGASHAWKVRRKVA
jgi:hypothetical protein